MEQEKKFSFMCLLFMMVCSSLYDCVYAQGGAYKMLSILAINKR